MCGCRQGRANRLEGTSAESPEPLRSLAEVDERQCQRAGRANSSIGRLWLETAILDRLQKLPPPTTRDIAITDFQAPEDRYAIRCLPRVP
jgi:hypothetical protein